MYHLPHFWGVHLNINANATAAALETSFCCVIFSVFIENDVGMFYILLFAMPNQNESSKYHYASFPHKKSFPNRKLYACEIAPGK